MKKKIISVRFNNIYSFVFSVVVMLLLISFIASRNLSLATLSEGFRWRNKLIEIYTSLRFEMGDRVFNGAVVGKDGWFFYTGEESVMDFQNTVPLTSRRMSEFQKALDRIAVDIEKNRGVLLVVIPPNKSTIYPQFMPDEIPVLGKESRLDQFVEYMKKNGCAPVLDLRQALLNAGKSNDVYFKTDTHWNSIGAYYGYLEIMNALLPSYPELAPHPLSDFEYKEINSYTGDILKIMGLPGYQETGWFLAPKFATQLTETSTTAPIGISPVTNNSLPRLLIYGDSFYGGLSKYIEPHFSSVKFIPFTTDSNIWSLDWILQEHADIVIIEIVERYLDTSLPLLLQLK